MDLRTLEKLNTFLEYFENFVKDIMLNVIGKSYIRYCKTDFIIKNIKKFKEVYNTEEILNTIVINETKRRSWNDNLEKIDKYYESNLVKASHINPKDILEPFVVIE